MLAPPAPPVTPCRSAAVDPFWRAYPQHMHQNVQDLLPRYRIGTLHPDDVARAEAREVADPSTDPYANDPVRTPVFITRCEKPFNGEPPPQLLGDNYVTPTELLFIRNHLPVPEVDAAAYRLEILGEGLRGDGPLRLSLHDIKTLFPRTKVTAVLQCAGNRRGDMTTRAKATRGLAWGIGAIGNVHFVGARLRDVLEWAGLSDEAIARTVRHIQFEGLDCDPVTGTRYAASIPADRAMDPHADVILAYEMNGKELTRSVLWSMGVVACFGDCPPTPPTLFCLAQGSRVSRTCCCSRRGQCAPSQVGWPHHQRAVRGVCCVLRLQLLLDRTFDASCTIDQRRATHCGRQRTTRCSLSPWIGTRLTLTACRVCRHVAHIRARVRPPATST